MAGPRMVAMEESRFSTGPVGQSAQSVQKRQRMLCPVLHQMIGVFFLLLFFGGESVTENCGGCFHQRQSPCKETQR